MFGEMDLVLIGGVVLLLFGPSKLPELMKGMGKGIREFKKAQADIETEINKVVNAPAEIEKPAKSAVSIADTEVSGVTKS